ncbi:hypothetical protein NC652_005155 [Populus alba x Populus x berolinensis]|nr:hypothetical protein NC652_005155 [Populus alba x Populus x berolinensis]
MHHCVNYTDANNRLSRFQLLLRSISTGAISEPHLAFRIPSLAQSVKWQLERLRSSQETSSSTCPKLSGLESLSQCVDDLLRLPLTHQALSNEQFQELADEGAALLPSNSGSNPSGSGAGKFAPLLFLLGPSCTGQIRHAKPNTSPQLANMEKAQLTSP